MANLMTPMPWPVQSKYVFTAYQPRQTQVSEVPEIPEKDMSLEELGKLAYKLQIPLGGRALTEDRRLYVLRCLAYLHKHWQNPSECRVKNKLTCKNSSTILGDDTAELSSEQLYYLPSQQTNEFYCFTYPEFRTLMTEYDGNNPWTNVPFTQEELQILRAQRPYREQEVDNYNDALQQYFGTKQEVKVDLLSQRITELAEKLQAGLTEKIDVLVNIGDVFKSLPVEWLQKLIKDRRFQQLLTANEQRAAALEAIQYVLNYLNVQDETLSEEQQIVEDYKRKFTVVQVLRNVWDMYRLKLETREQLMQYYREQNPQLIVVADDDVVVYDPREVNIGPEPDFSVNGNAVIILDLESLGYRNRYITVQFPDNYLANLPNTVDHIDLDHVDIPASFGSEANFWQQFNARQWNLDTLVLDYCNLQTVHLHGQTIATLHINHNSINVFDIVNCNIHELNIQGNLFRMDVEEIYLTSIEGLQVFRISNTPRLRNIKFPTVNAIESIYVVYTNLSTINIPVRKVNALTLKNTGIGTESITLPKEIGSLDLSDGRYELNWLTVNVLTKVFKIDSLTIGSNKSGTIVLTKNHVDVNRITINNLANRLLIDSLRHKLEVRGVISAVSYNPDNVRELGQGSTTRIFFPK